MTKSRSPDPLFPLYAQTGASISAAQRLLVRATRLEVVPLKFIQHRCHDHGRYFLAVDADGWIDETLVLDEGHRHILQHRTPFAGGLAVHVQQWIGYEALQRNIINIARRHQIDAFGPVPLPIQVQDWRFIENGYLVASYQRRGEAAMQFGLVYVPCGAGGGASITQATWARPDAPSQPVDIEAALRAAPPSVVQLRHYRR